MHFPSGPLAIYIDSKIYPDIRLREIIRRNNSTVCLWKTGAASASALVRASKADGDGNNAWMAWFLIDRTRPVRTATCLEGFQLVNVCKSDLVHEPFQVVRAPPSPVADLEFLGREAPVGIVTMEP